MQIITPGYRYVAKNLNDENGQTIQFIHNVPAEPGSTQLVKVAEGTTNEEIAAILIDRLKFLNEKFPCRQNALAITKFEEGLMWLGHRTNERKSRGVEGTQQR